MDKPEYFATLEHDRYRRAVIGTIAVQTQSETRQAIPKDVLMIGEDWIYGAEIKEIGRPEESNETQPLVIGPKGLYGLPKEVHLSRIIQDAYRFYKPTEKISLIPEGEQRIQEARTLGDITDEQEYSYKVVFKGKELSVYKIRNFTHTIDDKSKLANGDQVSLILFSKKD